MAAIDEIKDKVDGIEAALSSVSSSLGGFIGKKSYDEGIEKIESILENNFRKTAVKNATPTGTTTGGRTLGNTVGEMLGVLKNIDKHFIGNGSVNQGIKDLNDSAKKAISLLTLIEHHIGTNPSNSTTSTASNASANPTVDSIDKGVQDILGEIRKVTLILARSQYKTGDANLDKDLLAIAKLRAKWDKEEQVYKDYTKRIDRGLNLTDAEKADYERIVKERKTEEKSKKKRDLKERGGILGEKYGYGAGTVIANVLSKDLIKPFTNFVKDKPDASKSIDKGISIASDLLSKTGPWGAVAGGLMQAVKALFDLGAKQDKATTEFARTIGGFNRGKYLAGESVGGMVGNMQGGLFRNRGYTADAAYSAMTEIAEARGRTTERISAKSLESAIDLKRFGIGADAINNFDTFGKSLEETDRYFAKLYSEVSKKGLSFKNVSKAVNDNLKAAQSHSFANGLRGLEKMAEKSVQLKYNMQQVFQFADKVSEIEGAINTAANLSVLGGSFAQYSNPLQMLYEGLNDVEALQDRIENMFKGKAHWDSQKGEITMNPLEKQFVRQAAQSMGISQDEAFTMAFNQAKMGRVEKQLGKGLSKETTEYIKNIAELDKNGKAFVNLNGEVKDVSKLTENDKKALEKESAEKNKADNAKLGDIYQNTRSITEKMDNILTYLQEKLGRWVYKIAFSWMFSKDQRAEAQGVGSDYDKDMRGKLFDAYSGTDPKAYAKKLRDASTTQLEAWMEAKGLQQSPNGFNPMIPGNTGILRGPSHFDGGIKGVKNGIPWEAEGGEYLINKMSSSRYRGELNKIQNGTFNPYSYANDLIKNDMKRYFSPMNVAPVQNQTANENQPNKPNALNGTIKIDIPQTITINLAGGEKIGDYDVRGIIMNYVDKFMKEAQMRGNFSGFDKENFYNKSDVI